MDMVSLMKESNVSYKRITHCERISALDTKHIFSVRVCPKDFEAVRRQLGDGQSSKESMKTTFTLNDRIEARYAGRSRWYQTNT